VGTLKRGEGSTPSVLQRPFYQIKLLRELLFVNIMAKVNQEPDKQRKQNISESSAKGEYKCKIVSIRM